MAKFPTYEEMARNVAEKALDEYEYKGKTLREWVEIISAIPVTAIPATDTNIGTKHGTNLAEVGTDCISRQQAIDAVQNRHMMLNKEKVLLINDLEKLPSAEPKRGKWIHHPEIGWGETWLCDQCGEKTTSTVMGKPRDNFCPNCGAKMEVTTPPECEGDCGWCKPSVIEKCKGVTE